MSEDMIKYEADRALNRVSMLVLDVQKHEKLLEDIRTKMKVLPMPVPEFDALAEQEDEIMLTLSELRLVAMAMKGELTKLGLP
jgi:hypothetical protein